MRFLIFLLLSLFTFTGPLYAAERNLEYGAFQNLPVLHEGRVKPLDSFARLYLKSFSGSESISGLSAPEWLAETLFDPAQAAQRPIFKVRRPDLAGLKAKDSKLYSYAELAEGLKQKSNVIATLLAVPAEEWSADQRALIEFHEFSILYTQLLRTFSMMLPLTVTPPEILRKEWNIPPQENYNLLDFKKYDERLKARVEKIIKKKGSDPENFNADELAITTFAYQLRLLENASAQNVLLRILPGQWQSGGGEWFSPWANLQAGQGSPQSADYLQSWQNMIAAWHSGDGTAWQAATVQANNLIYSESGAREYKERVRVEILYNAFHLLSVAMLLYLASFMAVSVYAMRGNEKLRIGAGGLLALGFITHGIAIAMRMFILMRPPVGTLYESILFVSLICVLGALLFERTQKNGGGILTGSLAGGVLLAVATGFATDDTLKMLVAVLNTNFWLGTHVVCITIGYGWCIAGGIMAHLYMVRRYIAGRSGETQQKLMTNIKTVAIVALLFTGVGTALGGIWADQSWGRFWGWDPKENGALLIVLWLIWLLHGRVTGHIRPLHFAAGMAGLNIIVGLAWFGVNLLSIGLHSYGFISGIAAGLGSFVALELSFIAAFWFLIERKERAA